MDARPVLDALPDAILAARDGVIVLANEAAAALFAARLEDTALDAIVAPRHPRAAQLFASLARRGQSERIAVRRPAGLEFEVEASAAERSGLLVVTLRPCRDDRAPTGRGAGLDEVYRLVFENSPVGILHFDARGVITACNDSFVRQIGSSRRLLLGLDMLTLGGEPSRDRVVQLVRDTLAGKSSRYEGEYVSATAAKSTEVSLRFEPIRDAGGAVLGGVGITQDVTDLMRAISALRRSEESFRRVLELSPSGIAIERDAVVVFANAALARVLGQERPEDVVGRALLSLVHPDARDDLAAQLAQPRSSARPEVREARLLRADATLAEVELATELVEFQGGPARVLILRDITERKRIEARLNRADRLASIGTLAAGIAHEINNPLVYVTLGLELIERQLRKLRAGGKEQDFDELLGHAHNALEGAARVSGIVRDLRTFSRSSDEEQPGPVDVERCLESAINMAAGHIRARATLVRDFARVPPVVATEGRLSQVFVNLLVNAAQAIPEGDPARQRVTVRTRRGPRDTVCVEIEDSGKGIEPWKLERIFEPFWTDKPVGVGTGLGLSICHGIVAALGGEIAVRSEPGKGSTFSIKLPASADAPRTEEAAARAEQPEAAPRARLLLVDDEAGLGPTLQLGLRDQAEVVFAKSGGEALRILRADRRFDLILCDVMMPDLGGLEVYAQIAREAPALVPRFVFVTGGAVSEEARAFLEARPHLRLDKPFSLASVELLLRRMRAP